MDWDVIIRILVILSIAPPIGYLARKGYKKYTESKNQCQNDIELQLLDNQPNGINQSVEQQKNLNQKNQSANYVQTNQNQLSNEDPKNQLNVMDINQQPNPSVEQQDSLNQTKQSANQAQTIQNQLSNEDLNNQLNVIDMNQQPNPSVEQQDYLNQTKQSANQAQTIQNQLSNEDPNNQLNLIDIDQQLNPSVEQQDYLNQLNTPANYVQNSIDKVVYNSQTNQESANRHQNKQIKIVQNKSNYSKKQQDYRAQLNELVIKNILKISRCQIDPNCEFIWIRKQGQFDYYCPMCDEWDEIIEVQTRECQYCKLQAESFYITPCGHAYHDQCISKLVENAPRNSEIKCYLCTKSIHQAMIQQGYIQLQVEVA